VRCGRGCGLSEDAEPGGSWCAVVSILLYAQCSCSLGRSYGVFWRSCEVPMVIVNTPDTDYPALRSDQASRTRQEPSLLTLR